MPSGKVSVIWPVGADVVNVITYCVRAPAALVGELLFTVKLPTVARAGAAPSSSAAITASTATAWRRSIQATLRARQRADKWKRPHGAA